MNLNDSYNIFKLDLDGEEFDSDDDAILSGNIAFREILNNRDWKFLKTAYTLAAGSFDFSVIANLDKILDVWCNGVKLKKATFDNRFDTSFDYWIDHVNKMIVPINSGLSGSPLIIDYKQKPDNLEMDSVPVKDDLICPLIAYKMELNYLNRDQDLTTYETTQANYKKFFDLLVDYNESL